MTQPVELGLKKDGGLAKVLSETSALRIFGPLAGAEGRQPAPGAAFSVGAPTGTIEWAKTFMREIRHYRR